jgi:hypothetical protein
LYLVAPLTLFNVRLIFLALFFLIAFLTTAFPTFTDDFIVV